MLPVGVIVPTKNSAAHLPRHFTALQSWLDLVEQIVVVDSFSTDGTVELVKQNLRHPHLTFLEHPPGLYQSWNHAITWISAKYVYIATIGDLITREGLQRLVQTAESLAADLVISKPEFRDLKGRIVDIRWPIDDIIASLSITAPRRLHRLEAMVFACVHATAALTGSCASDLFRSEVLQRYPFPTEFGTAGDGAWGVLHAAEVAWAVLPDSFSSFLRHPSQASHEERQAYDNAPRMDQVLRSATVTWLRSGVIKGQDLAAIQWNHLLDTLSRWLWTMGECNRLRRSKFPWILRPAAWQARSQRTDLLAELHRLKEAALRQVAALDTSPTGNVQMIHLPAPRGEIQ
jgi:hypothetical protein